MSGEKEKDKSKVHKLSLKGKLHLELYEKLLTGVGSAKYVAEFVSSSRQHSCAELITAVPILHKHDSVGSNLSRYICKL